MALKRSTANEYKKRICKAMNFISENLLEEFTLDDVATAAAFSPFHFHRIFKAAVGETVSEFIRRLRLEKSACELSIYHDTDITSIAHKYSFSSSQNYAKAFKKHFGVSPSEFRAQTNCGSKYCPDNNLSFSSQGVQTIFGTPLDPNEKRKMAVEIKVLPEYRVAYIRAVGKYCKEVCEPAFFELISWAAPRGFFRDSNVFSIYWDNPEVTPDTKCRMDACVAIPEDYHIDDNACVSTQRITGGEYAIFHYEISEEEFQQVWQDSFKWIIENGYECDHKHCYERYNNMPEDHPEGKFLIDICIPLK